MAMVDVTYCEDCDKCVKKLPVTAMTADDARLYCKKLRIYVEEKFYCGYGANGGDKRK